MITLEVIATSLDDCWAAQTGGANRIELCSALPLGGLTPSLGLLVAARKAFAGEIMAMLRPRAGGFAYSEADFAVMCADAELCLRHGADGIVFGCLHPDGTVDGERTRRLVALAGGRQTVFHRAFDVTPDPHAALATLMQLGVTRVLSSGQRASALEGAGNLSAWRAYADRSPFSGLQILPGGGITVGNVRDILRLTGANQVHASLSGVVRDTSTAANGAIRFGAAAIPPEDQVRITDGALVAAMRRVLDGDA
jgi:copper homeostasis protein